MAPIFGVSLIDEMGNSQVVTVAANTPESAEAVAVEQANDHENYPGTNYSAEVIYEAEKGEVDMPAAAPESEFEKEEPDA